jgi:protein MpaA
MSLPFVELNLRSLVAEGSRAFAPSPPGTLPIAELLGAVVAVASSVVSPKRNGRMCRWAGSTDGGGSTGNWTEPRRRVARRLIASAPLRDAAIWVVPSLNPDGVAAGTRGNAHGVDLNRNFPFDWQPLGGLEYSGAHALSEPESRTAQRLILRVKPDLTIWFHQPLDLVDRSGGDPMIEGRFSHLVGLPLIRLSRYPGSASSWQNHALPNSTAFVVELPSVVRGDLVRRATSAVLTLANEYGTPGSGRSANVGGVEAHIVQRQCHPCHDRRRGPRATRPQRSPAGCLRDRRPA